jgi:chaperone BCS1
MVYTLSPTPFAQKTWDQGRHRPSRDISTVIMPPEEKEFLLQDVKEYLNPVTMRWYAQRGLPYRRGYLFHGPPGTGKTSLSLALAGELKLPLYILSLSTGSLTDETLTMLFVGLPRKCIVLLEDIDCAGVHRNGGHTDDWDYSSSENEDEGNEEDDTSSDDDSAKKSSGKSSKGSGGGGPKSSGPNSNKNPKASNNSNQQPRRPRISVSFSGLLNAIDGVASHEGRILIMTTNHRERLDSALIRPGRVDVQMEFGYARKETLAEIFRELYKEIGARGSIAGITSGGKLSEKKKQRGELAERDNVHRLAEEFAEKIPANRFTPAEIQGFLMSYKGQPDKAMGKVDAWVKEKTEPQETKTKAEKKRNSKKNTGTRIEKPVQEKAKPTTVANTVVTKGASPKSSSDPNTTLEFPDPLIHSSLAQCSENFLQILLHIATQKQLINSGSTTPQINGVATNGAHAYTNENARDDDDDDNDDDEEAMRRPASKDEAWEKLTGSCATPNGMNGTNGNNNIGRKAKGARLTNGTSGSGG